VIVTVVPGGCGGANPPANEIWARVDGTTSYDVSASLCDRPDCNAPADAHFIGATKNGSRVFFTTTQQLLNGDTDQTRDLYACDIPTAPQAAAGSADPCTALHEVSAGSAGGADVEEENSSGNGIGQAYFIPGGAISEDGSTAYFTAKGVLADNDDALGEEALPGDNNLYVWRTDAAHPAGQIAFIARLPENGDSLSAQTTPDGRYLALVTRGQLVPTDTDNATDVYRYDADNGELARVSAGVSGAGGNGEFDARVGTVSVPGTGNVPSTQHHSHPAISDNGQLIVFQTSEPLSPLDGNGEPDAYLWNDGHALGSVAPLLTGHEGNGAVSGSVFIDGSGEDIYVQTAARLTPSDGDTLLDVYDVRVDGGFAQHQEGCAGETCRPGATPAPAQKAPSSKQPGSGNPTQPKPCPKGKVKKHGKCVKKSSKKHSGKRHHGKKQKRASSNHGDGK
jgi:hypothetical protein